MYQEVFRLTVCVPHKGTIKKPNFENRQIYVCDESCDFDYRFIAFGARTEGGWCREVEDKNIYSSLRIPTSTN